ncbi:MAG: hypothetical protein CM15mV130_070 [Caudoviricetes sp.]|nr:MAG: hypothetical protein CM15mV130_070 [Caudoviricetes sp.]
MPKNNDPTNFTQKEMLLMILQRLDDMDKKVESLLEDKVSRKEFLFSADCHNDNGIDHCCSSQLTKEI